MIVAVMMYGCKIWILHKSQRKEMSSFGRSLLVYISKKAKRTNQLVLEKPKYWLKPRIPTIMQVWMIEVEEEAADSGKIEYWKL